MLGVQDTGVDEKVGLLRRQLEKRIETISSVEAFEVHMENMKNDFWLHP